MIRIPMNLSRNLTLKIHFLLDECLPPIIRDNKWFMWLPLRLFYGRYASLFQDFKKQAPFMSPEEMASFYAKISTAPPHRKTDLNTQSIQAVLKNVTGTTVLEVGAGDLYLAGLLSKEHPVTATDLYFSPNVSTTIAKSITLVQTPVEHLPFSDKSFDTVVCTHTLEHVFYVKAAMTELRRVAKKRVIVIVPKQRSYRYTFDPHLHFFPYEFSLRLALGKPLGPTSCKLVGGDWFYTEEIPEIIETRTSENV